MGSQLSFQHPHRSSMLVTVLAGVFAAVAQPALAFVSGSTGADGAFNPTVNTQLTLPPSGIFNFTTINIPAGVTVTFAKNATNTPVVMLATGDVTITGTINLDATDAAAIGGNIADDGLPGAGGPGGYAGGRGGSPGSPPTSGGNGLGPGGGEGGFVTPQQPTGYYGGNAGYSANGSGNGVIGSQPTGGGGGVAYGSPQLLPLIGGSGGGGGAGGTSFAGSGGGGGGGALLIASSGTLSIVSPGGILARGAGGSSVNFTGSGLNGGCGSGGGIRLVATTISGTGQVLAYSNGSNCAFGQGSPGFVRMESENFSYNGNANPTNSFAAPGPVFITGSPTVAITSVGGVAVPAAPTGIGDVQLPANTVNPVTVNFQTTGIPVGNTITLSIVPANGAGTKVTSGALTGSTSSASSSVQATLPSGPSTLLATVTYTIVASLGNELSRYAGNQRVERVEVAAALGGKSDVTLITGNGHRYPASPEAIAMLYGRFTAARGS